MSFFKFLVVIVVVGAAAAIPFLDVTSFLFKIADEIQDPLARERIRETTDISRLFLCAILALFAVGFSQLFLRIKWLRRFASSISGHLTALGILGTFVGIFFGLYYFRVDQLDKSIPLLLEGMKLAFTTSIAGLTTSTFLRVSHSIVVSFTHEDPYGIPGDDDGGTVVIVPGFGEYAIATLATMAAIAERLEKIHEVLKKEGR